MTNFDNFESNATPMMQNIIHPATTIADGLESSESETGGESGDIAGNLHVQCSYSRCNK